MRNQSKSGENFGSATRLEWQTIRYDSIGSTNDEAFRLYEEFGNDCLPNIVIANEQSGGRGQFDRKWVSPRGNLYCSFSLSKSFLEWKLGERLDQAEITKLIGKILFEAICSDLTSQVTERLSIKEPNDILYEGKKLAGILLEVRGDLVVIGIGVNVAVAPIEGSVSIGGLVTETLLERFISICEASLI